MSGLAEVAAAPEQLVAPELESVREPFVVIRQEVELELDFREKSVSGVTNIWIFTILPPVELGDISIDARQFEIITENITVDGVKTTASYSDPYESLKVPSKWQLGAAQHHVMKKRMGPVLPKTRPELSVVAREKNPGCIPNDRALKISLKPEVPVNEARRPLKIKIGGSDPTDEIGVKISIPFRSKTLRDGLHFVGVDQGDQRYPHVYTRHSTEAGTASCIFPCVDDPRSRNPWKISIKCPRLLGDIFQQPAAPQLEKGPNKDTRKRKYDGQPTQPAQHAVLAEEDKLMEMTVVCSGTLISEQIDPKDERKKIMTFDCKNAAAQHLGFAVGPFEHVDLWHEFRTEESDEKLGANASKIHGYCLPGRAEEVRHTCSPIVAASDYFALEFGKFPFESYKMCFLEDMIPETMPFNSLSFCSTRMLYPEDTIDTEIEVTRKLVYSLAIQYLGVNIIPDAVSDSWIVIGMAWFITDLFMRTICGVNWYKFHMKTQSDKLVELDVNRPALHDLGKYLYVGEFELEFMELKAPLVLFILDQRMSKYAGCSGIARVISQIVSAANINPADPKSTSISLAELTKICEKKSHYRTHNFWQDWVYGAGCPRLQIKQRFNKKNLNVDLQITQNQRGLKHPISKEAFWREYQEELHEVYAGEVAKFFSGPFTVRIHEADGTPYEHYLDIKQDDKDGLSWSIPYNTKYKRLKRSKKKDGGAGPGANLANKQEIPEDDVVYFNMLGDVLHSDQEKKNWGLHEWEKSVQDAMDQESYEWIRFDCNFEWLCQIVTDMPGYMYLAQLQQDRDVVAHQDAMLFFIRAKRHQMSSTIEARTLVDKRYYSGIRILAASDLPKQCTADLKYWGLAHLILAFRHFFCYRVVGKSGVEQFAPVPNDFSDKAQYAVQCAIIAAIARTRDAKGRCSEPARNFLLDLIRFNDNSSNEYSDHFYVAKLLDALTTSLIPENPVSSGTLYDFLIVDNDEELEFKQFIDKTVETIERFRRMDEWTSTYHNIWTTTALDCKMRLMKAKVIPMAPLYFLQYCQDENLDLVRIKAWECLIDLGVIAKTPILKLLLNAMSTDKSPFVRHHLFKAFCRGIAAIGLGELQLTTAPATPPATATNASNANANADADADTDADADGEEPDPLEMEDDNGGLVIEQGDKEIEQRKLNAKRKEDIGHTLAALKEELKGNVDLQIGIWRAFESETISLAEKRNLLELCAAMFEPEDSLLLTFQYPKTYRCTRRPTVVNGKNKRSLIVDFVRHYRTTPRVERLMNPPPPLPAAVDEKPPEGTALKKIKISSKPSFSGPSPTAPGTPGTSAPHRMSISIPTPGARTPLPSTAATATATPVLPVLAAPAADSIAVHPMVKARTPLVASPFVASPPPTPAAHTQQPNGQVIKQKSKPAKRPSEERAGGEPPSKKVKSSTKNGRSRIVKLPFTKWGELKADTRAKIKSEAAAASTIVATPAARLSAASPATSPGNSSYSPRAVGSPASGGTATPGSSFQSSGPASGSVKVRKPLPGSVPAAAAASSAPVNGAMNGSPVAVTAPAPKKLIKLKLKSFSKPSPQPPSR